MEELTSEAVSRFFAICSRSAFSSKGGELDASRLRVCRREGVVDARWRMRVKGLVTREHRKVWKLPYLH